MKRTTTNSSSKFTEFLESFMTKANDGIHDELESSKDYLARREVDDYITDEGLDVRAVEANEDLTVADVLEIGIHFARYNTHRNWHDTMDKMADKAGVNMDKLRHKNSEVHIVTDPDQLPEEVKQALRSLLGLDDKKGKK